MIKIIAVMNMVRGSIAAPLCRFLRKVRRTQKSPAHVPPKGNVSCAGAGAIIARPPIVAIASLRRFATVDLINWPRTGGRGCSTTATGRSCACARRLRTGAPAAKPPILGITRGILEALISVLHRPSMEALSLGCSHEGSESGQGRYRHHKLAHCSLPLRVLVVQPSVALILH